MKSVAPKFSLLTFFCVYIISNCTTNGLNSSCDVIRTNQTCYLVERGQPFKINFNLKFNNECRGHSVVVVKNLRPTSQKESFLRETTYCQVILNGSTTDMVDKCYGNRTTDEYTVNAVAGEEGQETWKVKVQMDDKEQQEKVITVNVTGIRDSCNDIRPVSRKDNFQGPPTPPGSAPDTGHKVLIAAVIFLIFVVIGVYWWGRRKSMQNAADLDIADSDVKGLHMATNGCSIGPTGVQDAVFEEENFSNFYRPYSNDARGSVGTYAEVGLDTDIGVSMDPCAAALPPSHKGRQRESYDHLNSTSFSKQPQNIKEIKTGTGRNLYSSFKAMAKGYKP